VSLYDGQPSLPINQENPLGDPGEFLRTRPSGPKYCERCSNPRPPRSHRYRARQCSLGQAVPPSARSAQPAWCLTQQAWQSYRLAHKLASEMARHIEIIGTVARSVRSLWNDRFSLRLFSRDESHSHFGSGDPKKNSCACRTSSEPSTSSRAPVVEASSSTQL